MPRCLIGLGSNLGDRSAHLDGALSAIDADPALQLLAHSAWHETPPIGGPAGQAAFLNGCLLLETTLPPEALLDRLLAVEDAQGRQRAARWAARTLDLDLLLYDRLQCAGPRLVVPHPRMAWRRFVLEPAAEIAPAMRHPTSGWTLAELAGHLATTPPYVAVTATDPAAAHALAQRAATDAGATLLLAPLEGWREESGPEAVVPTLDSALEWVARCVELLRGEAWRGGEVALSDFWLPTATDALAQQMAGAARAAFVAQAQELSTQAALPRLVVLADPAAADDAPAAAIAAAAGPVLRCAAPGLGPPREELVAAIAAMQ